MKRRIHALLSFYPASLLVIFVVGCDSRTEEAALGNSAEKSDEPKQESSAPILHSVVFQKIYLPAEGRGRTRNETQDLAERIRTQVDGGEDFALLARTHSEDCFAADGGVIDLLLEDLEEGPFMSFVESAGEGELSRVIGYPEGFVVAQLLKRRYRPISLSETIASLGRKLKQEAGHVGAGEAASRAESELESDDKPQTKSEGRSR